MAKNHTRNTRRQQSGSNPTAIIKAYTNSAEKIGPDAALIALLSFLGFTALALKVEVTSVVILCGVIWLLWAGLKFGNAYIKLQHKRLSVQKLQRDQGERILDVHRDRQDRLSLSKPSGDDK